MTTEISNIIKQSMYSTKLSRLLAEENINVQFSEYASTASFTPTTRTLTFPYSTSFMDTDIHELFMFHEISHALHLPHDIFDTLKEKEVDTSLFNIVIDIRDERLIKKKYPGSVKTFHIAYSKLLSQNFFGDAEMLKSRSFADRLNVYAKVGVKHGSFIPMSSTEHAFYEKCMKIETIDEAIAATFELAQMNEGSTNDDALEQYVIEKLKTENEDGEPLEPTRKEIEEMMDALREERVQRIFDEKFKDSTLKNTMVFNYVPIHPKYVQVSSQKDYVKLVKEIEEQQPKEIEEQQSGDSSMSFTSDIRALRKNISQSVDSMVRVFESKKAAMQYQNVKIADTGMIDINRIYRYKFDDNVFRKSMSVPNSKNHAYYLLVDLSGSMSSIFEDVVEQIIAITEFLRRIQVPYKVVGFGSNIDRFFQVDPYQHPPRSDSTDNAFIRTCNICPLFEILSSTQTTHEHNLALAGLSKYYGWHFGSTPTSNSLLHAEIDAAQFFKAHNVSKKHMVVITDGEPTDIAYGVRRGSGSTVMLDTISKKSVVTNTASPYAIINAMGKVIEHRHGIEFTTISIMNSLNLQKTSAFVSAAITDQMKLQWRNSGYTKLVDPYTKNEVFVAKSVNVETDVGGYELSEKDTSSRSIAKALLKNMRNVKKSRNFLNALAEKLS